MEPFPLLNFYFESFKYFFRKSDIIMKKLYTNILKHLDQIINESADHIHDFIDSPSAFTRKRKLDAFTLIKTTLNMQGNSRYTVPI